MPESESLSPQPEVVVEGEVEVNGGELEDHTPGEVPASSEAPQSVEEQLAQAERTLAEAEKGAARLYESLLVEQERFFDGKHNQAPVTTILRHITEQENVLAGVRGKLDRAQSDEERGILQEQVDELETQIHQLSVSQQESFSQWANSDKPHVAPDDSEYPRELDQEYLRYVNDVLQPASRAVMEAQAAYNAVHLRPAEAA